MATISLLLSSTLISPKLILFFTQNAVTICKGNFLLFDAIPFIDLPSKATTSLSVISAIDFIQLIKHSLNSFGSRIENKSLIASCDGVPFLYG